jgi:hypothetical protein
MQTLKHLVVNIHLENVEAHDDPLCGIPSELEDMGTKNIIESITIVIKVHWSCSRGDSWGRLDEVLTTPGWFALKRVSLAIKMNTYSTSDDEEGSLRKLPKTQFPRLSTSNSVSFDFEVT